MTKKFCYRQPDYPKDAYVALLFMEAVDEPKSKFLYPMTPIYPSLKMMWTKLKHFKKRFEGEGGVRQE